MNKTLKKILSVVLCVVMIFSTVSVALAADVNLTYSMKYFQKTSTDEKNAAIVLDKLDEILKDADLNSSLNDYQSILNFMKTFGITIDLGSVNGLCKTIDSVIKVKGVLGALGDLGDMNFDVWETGMQRPNDVKILNEIIELVGTSEYKKNLFGMPATDKLNAQILAGIFDGTTNFGLLLDSTIKDVVKDKLGKDGISGMIKSMLVGLVYENDKSTEYKNAYAKKLDNFLYEDVIGLVNKEDGALPGFTFDGNSTVDNLLLSLFNSAWNKYVIDLIRDLDVDLSTSENEALQKLGEVINLDGSLFDPSTVTIDLSKSFESQINNILGAVVKFFFPAANWANGGKEKLAGNFEQLYKDVAAAFGVEANPLAIAKYVLANLEIEGLESYVGDFESWTSMQNAVAAVLLNVANQNEIPVKKSAEYETILGDMLTYLIQDYVDLGYTAGTGKNIWTVLNDIVNVFLVDKGFANALSINVSKSDSIFVKIDKMLDMTGTKFASYSSEEFIKGIIDAVFDFDFATAIDKTVITFLNDYANEKAINVIYDAVYTFLKNSMGKEIIVARATATPLDNAVSNSSLKATIRNLLTALNSKKSAILPPVLYLAAVIIGGETKENLSISDQTLTGKAIIPATIKFGDKTLKLGTDYTATAVNNVEPGTATVTITFTNQYKGEVTTTFKIVFGKLTNLKATSGKTDSASLSWTAVAGAEKYEVTCDGKTQTVNTNKATLSGLTAGKEYKATVKAIRGNSSSSASVSFVTNPAKVTGLKASTVKATSVKLSWTKTANATSYEIQSSTDGKTWTKAATSTTNSVTVSSLTANKSYKFKVRAVTKASAATTYGAYSDIVSAKTLLATVTGLKASKTADTSISLTWTKVSGAAGYTVSYSTDGKTWKTKKVTTNSLSLTGLKANTAYQIKVCAYDKADVAGANSSVLKVTTLLAKVTGVKISDVKAKSFKVTWTKVSGADTYTVEYSKDGKTWTKKKDIKTNSVTISSLTANTAYQVRVTAYKGKTAGVVSAVSKTTTLLAAPTSLKASKTTKDTVTLTWKKVTGAAGYEIYRNGKKVAAVTKGATVTFTDKKLSKNTTYKYTVKAYKVVSKKNVLGEVSSTVSAKTKSK